MKELLSISDMTGHIVESLDALSIIAILFGIVVIIIKNPIGSLISLIGLFGAIAVYLILIGLTFIGFSYLIVYIGAVSILFLFILMLINVRSSELQSNNSNSIPLALFVSIFFNYALFQVLPYYVIVLNSNFNYFALFSSMNKSENTILKN
jgi:NADH-ubiquinone oxidoreductase chain 6